MRDYAFTPSASRVVSAKVVFTDTLPVFSAGDVNDNAIAGWTSYDAGEYNSGLFRVAVVGGFIHYQIITALANLDDPDNYPWEQSSLEVKTGSKIGLFENRIFYQGTDGHVYFVDLTNGELGTPIDMYTSIQTLALAPSGWEVVYATYLQTANIKRIVRIIGGDSELWSGAIYATDLDLFFDVGRSDGIDYILTSEDEGKRIIYLTYQDGIWSDTKYVFPLDVLDDTSYYRMCSISIVNGKFVLTNKVRRSNGPIMLTYAFGPEMYTAGREMFIEEVTEALPFYGKMHKFNSKIAYIGPEVLYVSDPTTVFGETNVAKVHEVTKLSRLKVAQGDGGSEGQVSLADDAYIPSPGMDMQAYQIVDGIEYLLGTFDVNTVSEEIKEAGVIHEAVAKGKATRRLSQWESDTSIDYWSQTKQISTPKDRGELVRVTGIWDWSDTELKLTDLNTEGYLSIVAKACRDGEMRLKFSTVAGSYHGRIGVGLQFYRLNVLEIAEALDKEAKDLTEAEADATGPNGILALYGPVEDSGDPGIGLYKIRNGVLTQLESAALTIPDTTDYWLMISSHDGYYKVEYRADSSPTWVLALDYTYTDDDGVWKSGDLFDKVGRGFMFVCNDTPHALCYPFQATATYIALKESHSAFPASGTVIVDEEQITYSAKSSNATHYGPFDCLGENAIDANDDLDNSLYLWPISHARYNVALRGRILKGDFYLRRVEAYISQVGYPDDGVKCCVYTRPITPTTPTGKLVASVTIPRSEFPDENYYWTAFEFPSNTKFTHGDWIMFYREHNPTHPQLGNSYSATLLSTGTSQSFDEDLDIWEETGGGIAYRIYGTPISMGQMYGVVIEGGPNVGAHALDGCVLVGVSGAGKNAQFTIVGYKYGVVNSVVYVSQDPSNTFSTDTKVAIAPTLTISGRGQNDTVRTSHGDTQVDVYSLLQHIIKNVQYFSNDIDITAGEMAVEICRKAGVEAASRLDAVSGTVSLGAKSFSRSASRNNFITRLSGAFSDHRAGVFITNSTGGAVVVWLDVTEASLVFIPDIDTPGTSTIREEYAIQETMALTGVDTQARFSYNDGAISVWLGDRFIHSFVPTDTLDGGTAGPFSEDEWTWIVDWEEADMRCDNFILDMGRKGAQLLMDLIGEKRIFFLDKPDGSLELFTSHEEVTGTVNLICESGDIETNEPVATRIRTEGGDVYEDIADGIKRHGNVFRLMNSRESNDLQDTIRFTELAIDDIEQRENYNVLRGSADPRIEAFDRITLIGSQEALVDTVDYNFVITEEEVIYDMEVRSRWLEA